ncbi:Tryptophan--tRNA ligase [Candidatus Tiddalikarchaeum anstoanum]|nr:Tryptophan--tRNA ligase [Candidatus Tiddalikarchaeum anstoanum]
MVEDMKVTPWDVKGNIDYDRLIKEFGTERLDSKLLKRIEKHTGSLHTFLRRGIFFSHRDMNWILDEYEKGNKFFLYTGRSPSGDVHIGHLVPWIFTKWLQDKFNVDLWFQFPDEEKFLFKDELTFKDTEHYLHENMLDVIALGFNPKKTKFLIDTRHAGLMYKPACEVAKKITFSTVKSSFGFDDSFNIGQIFYTAMQSVPAFLPSVLAKKNIPCLIPYAIDQDPHFRITRDVLPKMGYYKPAAIHSVFLPPLTGSGGKMSSSIKTSAIYTTDSPKVVKDKVMKYAFSGGRSTLEEHRRLGGNPDVDVPYQWLRFFEDDDVKLKQIYDDYKSGKMLTGEIKQILIDKLNAFLEKHQERRLAAKDKIDEFILKV